MKEEKKEKKIPDILRRWAWCPHCWVRTKQVCLDRDWLCEECGKGVAYEEAEESDSGDCRN